MTPIRYQEGVLIDWSPTLPVRMLVRGVEVGDRRVPRPEIARRLLTAFAAWFRWTVATPGDRFWDIQRDLIIEVAHGTPSRRTARFVTGMALHSPVVQKMGVDAVFSMTPPEPCHAAWWQVAPFSRNEAQG